MSRASTVLNLFDAKLGRALHDTLDILPADAGNEGPWSFLSAMVFPDLVSLRFPDLHEQRVVGEPRNALRRAWQRYEVLGERVLVGDTPLQEDEIVQITERTAFVRNRRIAKFVAEAITSHDHPQRTLCTRLSVLRIMRLGGPLMLDLYPDDELRRVVTEEVARGHLDWERSGLEADASGPAVQSSVSAGISLPARDGESTFAETQPTKEADRASTERVVVRDMVPETPHADVANASSEPVDLGSPAPIELEVASKYLRPPGEDMTRAWHPDPWGLARLRWWDGDQWTADTAM
jgi:hypothetical protein